MKKILVLAFMFLVLEVSGITEYAAAVDRFVNNNNGTVTDTQTGLMWAAKDNGSSNNWKDAKSYCENYRGGGYTDWRMPTRDELAGLYDEKKTYKTDCGGTAHLTELIRLTCAGVWASETHDLDVAFFDFLNGHKYWCDQNYENIHIRSALPVRSGEAILSTVIPAQSTDIQSRSKASGE